MFDANALLNAVTTNANETKRKPLTIGDYLGQITNLKLSTQPIKKGPKAGEVLYKLTFGLVIDGDPKLPEGMSKFTLNAEVVLDLTANGTLDFGPNKNLQLGRIREAVGLNTPGHAFNLGMLNGQMLKFTVSHEPAADDPEIIYERVKGFRSPTSAD